MTLDEAIEHCRNVADASCSLTDKCANEHRQLSEWLMELKHCREQNKPDGKPMVPEQTCKRVVLEKSDYHGSYDIWGCSNCGVSSYEDSGLEEGHKYCPNCGARVIADD